MILHKGAFCDLDNTMIFSHRKDIGEKILVERLHGKEQAYMPRRGYDLLQMISKKEFIPVTSRREEQYKRISFFTDGLRPTYALIDNGGVLLIDGERDPEWVDESHQINSEEIKRLIRMQQVFSDFLEIKLQDQLILFMKPGELADEIKAYADSEDLMTFSYSDKMYICSKKLTKGNAIKRFITRFPIDYIIVAGDSDVDESMIDVADKAFMSVNLPRKCWERKNVKYINPVDIAENVFAELLEMSMNR